MQNQISRAMEQEHQRIECLIDDLKKISKYDLKAAEKTFKILKWSIEKHIFTEEKVIFSVYSVWFEDEDNILDLLKENKDILFLIQRVEECLSKYKIPDLSELKGMLKEHFEFESSFLFPRFEEILDQTQKSILTERVEEVILG